MDICILGSIFGIIFLGLIVFLIYLDLKKHHLITIQNSTVIAVKNKALYELNLHGFKIKDDKKQTFVEENSLIGATLIFQQDGTNVKILRKNATTLLGLVLVLILTFTVFIGGLILAIFIDWKSSKFANETILPILSGTNSKSKYCPYCNKPIPINSSFCPYCTNRI